MIASLVKRPTEAPRETDSEVFQKQILILNRRRVAASDAMNILNQQVEELDRRSRACYEKDDVTAVGHVLLRDSVEQLRRAANLVSVELSPLVRFTPIEITST